MENFIVISAFLSFTLFIFPIFITISAVISGEKAAFSIYVFSVIKLFGGYVTFHKSGYAVHISEKKAFFVEYKKMNEERKKFAVTEGFQLFRLHLTAELNKDSEAAIPFAVFFQSVIREIFARIRDEKRYLSLKSGVLLSAGKTNITATTVTVFNGFAIARAAVKIITGSIITKIWRKRQKI